MITGSEFENRLANISRKHKIEPKEVLNFVKQVIGDAQIEYAIIPDEFPFGFDDIFEIFIITKTLLYDIEMKNNKRMTYLVTPFRSIVNVSRQVRSSGLFDQTGDFDQVKIQLVNGKHFYLINHHKYSPETIAFLSQINKKMGEY